MTSIKAIADDLNFSRTELLATLAGLSNRELTQLPVDGGWTAKEILAHIVGWDRRTLHALPLIVANRAGEVTGVDVEAHNRQAVAAYAGKSMAQLLADAQELHRQIVAFITGLDYPEIDRRRERNGRIITIRSYIIDIMVDHERRHTAELELWREKQAEAIDPAVLTANMRQQRSIFMEMLGRVTTAAHLTAKNAEGEWSVSDVVGHLADWEQLMLTAARHIHDPSLPPAQWVGKPETDWNALLAARRQANPFAQNRRDLLAVQSAVDEFVANLTPGDWRLRGPYPWPNDQGTLAELIFHLAEHYTDHILPLQQWLNRVGD